MLSGKATNTNYIAFGLTQTGLTSWSATLVDEYAKCTSLDYYTIINIAKLGYNVLKRHFNWFSVYVWDKTFSIILFAFLIYPNWWSVSYRMVCKMSHCMENTCKSLKLYGCEWTLETIQYPILHLDKT